MYGGFEAGLSVHERRATVDRRMQDDRRLASRRHAERRVGFALIPVERRRTADRRATERRTAQRRAVPDRRVSGEFRVVT